MAEENYEYRKLQGMELEYKSGVLEEHYEEEVGHMIGYTITFRLPFDFTHFVQAANTFIPGYLNDSENAIRPMLNGLAYHNRHNNFGGSAGTIHSTEALFNVFSHPDYYDHVWGEGALWVRYHKPVFKVVDGQFEITARSDFRLRAKRQIQISDLPVIWFGWELYLILGHNVPNHSHPSSGGKEENSLGVVASLGYAQEALVEVEDQIVRRGTKYMIGKNLSFDDIAPELILTAS